ncbi:MAG: protein kinase domain-containing protein [Planctomycetales bacterium]|jgi:serine/threonine protein kinase
MASYRYQRGDRPLEGYTIEHAVGRGGFGEVYYAVSDSGKQVALKAVQNHEDIELRGSTHCMNLKSPHLVTIFDVRHSERGDPFVIMEYVSGPSLRELLDDSPEGLGPEKSAWFIREISKAVSLLHDNGIVHRDLKPHNVFFEDGYVMVGDYSLSKVITTSHRSGHTLTVGTVHYMAPEISLGRYDRTVDIYAMGVMLYEMLTGKPPFLGESMGEVLMKHMSQEADVSSLPQPFAAVVQKAMARDPETRYQSADELVEALFGTDAVRDGASGFDPGSLTMIARRAVEKSRPMPATIARDSDAHKAAPRPTNDGDDRDRFPAGSRPSTQPARHRSQKQNNPNTLPFWLGQLISRGGARLAIRSYPEKAIFWERSDELSFGIRSLLAAAAVFLGSIGIIYLCEATGQPFISPGLEPLFIVPLLAISVTAGAALAGWLLAFFRIRLPWLVIRGVYYAASGFPLFVFSLINNGVERLGADFAIALIMPVLVMDWRWITSSRRRCRVNVVPSLVAAVITLIASLSMFSNEAHVIAAVGLVTTVAMATQLLMPFSESRSQQVQDATDWMASLEGLAECLALDEDEVGRVTPEEAGGDAPFSEINATEEEHFINEESPDGAERLRTDGDSDVWWEPAKSRGDVRPDNSFANESGEVSGDKSSTDTPLRGRIPALVLSLLPLLMMPLCGLQRFYVGKNLTGVLYLLTLGLFGVGQLIDIVLIALGEFRDSEGRLLTTWRGGPQELSTVGEKVNSLSVVPAARSLFSDGLAAVGGLALAIDIALGFLLAIGGPKLIAAGVFSPIGLSPEFMTNMLGMANWQDLVFDLWAGVCGILSVATVGLLMTSRIRYGAAHVARVIPVVMSFSMVFGLLTQGTYRVRWDAVVESLNRHQIGPALQALLSDELVGCSIGSAVAFSVGLFILAWPPRRESVVITEQVRTPVAQRH